MTLTFPTSERPARRLLLVAWAGADWRIAGPLIEAGELPHLAALVAAGASGNLATLNPHSAPMQWTALLTGKRADKHGLLGYWRPAPEGPVPVSGRDRAATPLWDMIGAAGLRVHAVNWPFSHPAGPVDGVMVSDLFGRVGGDPEAPSVPVPETVWPAETTAELEDLRIHPGELGLHDLSFFVRDPGAVDQGSDPLLGQVAVAVARSGSTHAAATALLERADWDAALVQYDALDALGPGFMALRPPRLEYVPPALMEHYGDTVAAMYRFLDMQLGRLLELAGPDCTVLLVSQRGYRDGALRPQTAEAAAQRLAAPWFRDQGMIVLAGPGVRPGVRIEGAGLLDVVPTVLSLLGLPLARDMDGRPLRACLDVGTLPRPIGSWEPAPGERQTPPPLDGDTAAALRRNWFVWPDAPAAADAAVPEVAAVAADWEFNLALCHLEANRPERAGPLLARLAEAAPEDARLKIHLARCREALGDRDGAAGLYAEVVEEVPGRPREQMALAALNAARQDDRAALMNLFRAEQANPNDPMVHGRIGEVYLRMRRPGEALRAFGRALALDPDMATAHHGRAVALLGQDDFAGAAEAALTAVGLRHQNAAAHVHLGEALVGLGQPEAAIAAFETALEVRPRYRPALQRLVRLLERQGDCTGRLDEYRRHLAELAAADILRQRARDRS